MTATQLDKGVDHFRLGLTFAIGSALSFGMSGPMAKALMDAGWSPTGAVTARMIVGALAMAVFATIVRPGWVREAVTHRKMVIAYGIFPIAGAQLCYYNAVAHLSVGVALLLEYTAPVLVVGWLWATTRRRPTHLTLAGVALAVAGIMLVLDVFAGAHINAAGVAWGLAAAVCAASYFMLSDKVAGAGDDDANLNPITLAAGGLIVGAATTGALGVTGIMPLTFTTNDAVVAGLTMSPIVPVVALGVITTAIAYTLGIMGISRLRPRFASLVGLSEVLFAVLAAWLLLGQAITVTQAVGGAVVLAGLALARQGDRSENLDAVTWLDAGAVDEPTPRSRANG
ncbi:DMT family transporter [Mycobacterium sp. ITM-2016-00318]|uniref:EamA family transporter n=1 Tax=Mycobacterium sp. ITM-2016-00318 TaxID=2099693 RepID=UPI000CF8DD1D|nr:EamA family transporter [Mycobacterium sp. ITM-2016-00318]WNG93950.1 EamA family transporter [Mycobacterium sp. ITM-2016-00318]